VSQLLRDGRDAGMRFLSTVSATRYPVRPSVHTTLSVANPADERPSTRQGATVLPRQTIGYRDTVSISEDTLVPRTGVC